MKVSSHGLLKIANRIEQISAKLNLMVGLPKLNASQRETFRELQDELQENQRRYRIFSDPDAGK